jgi:hypothetical protein
MRLRHESANPDATTNTKPRLGIRGVTQNVLDDGSSRGDGPEAVISVTR